MSKLSQLFTQYIKKQITRTQHTKHSMKIDQADYLLLSYG